MIIVDESLPEGEIPPPFPPKDVEVKFNENIRDDYDLKKEIGRGRFGTVYLCTCKKTNLNFAAKFVNTKRKQDRKNVEREIEIMKTLSDKGARQKLIQLYDAYDMGNEMCLVLEIVEGGELFERVTDDDFELTERACAIFIRQVCEAIEYVHSKNILHLDMKPENILCLSREGNRVKICDFGLARKYDPRKKLQVLFGTPEFVAPEVVNFEPISFGTDMWSIGVICYVLLSGLSPFMGHNYVETMTNVTHNKYDFDDEAFDEVSDDAKDFIERLLLLDKSERMTPNQCYRHRWLKNLENIPKYQDLNTNIKKISKAASLEDLNSTSNIESEFETLSASSTEMIIDGKLNIPLKNSNVLADRVGGSERLDNMYDTPVEVVDKSEIPELGRDLDQITEVSSDGKPGSTSPSKLELEISYKRKSSDIDEGRRKSIIINTPDLLLDNEDVQNDAANSSLTDTENKTKFLKTEEDLCISPVLVENKRDVSHDTSSTFMKNAPENIPTSVEENLDIISCTTKDNTKLIDEQELDITKENLREFVERWHSQSSSPLVVGSPKSTSIVCRLGDEMYGETSILKPNTSLPKQVSIPSSAAHISETGATKSKGSPLTSRNSEANLAEELEKRLMSLKKNRRDSENAPDCIIEDNAGTSKDNHKEKLTDKDHSEKKDIAIKENLSHKKSIDRENQGIKLKPSRDVINQPAKCADIEKSLGISPTDKHIISPVKLSRKASKEKEERPLSRDSNRSTPAKVRRRPSRDVPMAIAQSGRINSITSVTSDRHTTIDLWPDMICLSKDEQDSSDPSENESEGKAITGKLQLPVTAIPSSFKEVINNSTSIQQKNAEHKKRRSYDESNNKQMEKQIVTWMLDLNGVKIPDSLTQKKNSIDNKRENVDEQANEKQDIPTTSTVKSLVPDVGSTVSTSRTSSARSSKSNSSENLIIQTPWGPMRRSPSKSSIKGGDNTTIINISDCFINVTKPKMENKSDPTVTSIKIIPAKNVDNKKISGGDDEHPGCQDRRRSFIEKNKIVNDEIHDATELSVEKNLESTKPSLMKKSEISTPFNSQDKNLSVTSTKMTENVQANNKK